MSSSNYSAFIVQCEEGCLLDEDIEDFLQLYLKKHVGADVEPDSVILHQNKTQAYFEIQQPLRDMKKLDFASSTNKLIGMTVKFTPTSATAVKISGLSSKHTNSDMIELIVENFFEWNSGDQYSVQSIDKANLSAIIHLSQKKYAEDLLKKELTLFSKSSFETRRHIEWLTTSLKTASSSRGDGTSQGDRRSHGDRASQGDGTSQGDRRSHSDRASQGDGTSQGDRTLQGDKTSGGDRKAHHGSGRKRHDEVKRRSEGEGDQRSHIESQAMPTQASRPKPRPRTTNFGPMAPRVPAKVFDHKPSPKIDRAFEAAKADIKPQSEEDEFEDCNTEMTTEALPEGKFRLAKLIIQDLQVIQGRDVQVTYLDKERKVRLIGEDEKISKLKRGLYAKLASISEEPLSLDQGKEELLKSEDGLRKFHDILKNNKIVGLLFYKSTQLYGISNERHGMRDIKALLNSKFRSDNIPLQKDIADICSTEEWKKQIELFKKKVNMSVIVAHGEIILCAFDDDFQKAKTKLTNYMQHDLPHVKRIPMEKMHWLLIKNHLMKKVHEAIESKGGRQMEYNVDVKGDDKRGTDHQLVITSRGDAVEQMGEEVQSRVIEQIAEGHIDVHTEGVSKASLEKRRHFLIRPVEREFHCVMRVEEGEEAGGAVDFEALLSTEGLVRKPPDILLQGGTPRRHGVNIAIEKGDIAKFRADVLVNPVTGKDTTLMNMGAVCKSFAREGGNGLSQAYVLADGPVSEGGVIVTHACGNLKCRYVFHAGIRAARPGEEGKLADLVIQCLRQAMQLGVQSIAFNTIGCGNLKYSETDVIRAFKMAQASVRGSLQIHIVAYDMPTKQKFVDALLSADNMQFQRHGQSDLTSLDFLRDTSKKPRIHIWAENRKALDKAKAKLKSNLEIVSSTETVPFAYGRYMKAEHKVKLEALDDLGEAEIFVEERNVVVTGEETAVRRLKREVEKLLVPIEEEIWSPGEVSRCGRDEEFLSYLKEKEHKAPGYWKLQGLLREKMAEAPAELVTALQANDGDYQGIAEMVQKSCNVQVKSVKRIENIERFNTYIEELTQICTKGVQLSVEDLDSTKVTSYHVASDSLKQRLVHQVNEHYLFIAAQMSGSIPRQPDFREEEGDFGRGLHFTENIIDGASHIFVTRVLLGAIFLSITPKKEVTTKYKREFCLECKQDPCIVKHEKQVKNCDSIMGTGHGDQRSAHRKFVLFNNKRFYTEYLVELVR